MHRSCISSELTALEKIKQEIKKLEAEEIVCVVRTSYYRYR
jgi:hypothetical protein